MDQSEWEDKYLQPWINCKTTSCGIHTRNILAIMNIFQCYFCSVVPMTVVQMLTDQSMRLYCPICVHLKKVEKYRCIVLTNVLQVKLLIYKIHFLKNKLDFKGHPQRLPKLISNQNLLSWFSCFSTVVKKVKSKDQVILKIFYVKEPNNLICREKFGSKLKNQIVSMNAYPCTKNWYDRSIQSWHVADLILGITLGMFRRTWPHSYEQTKSYRCI